MGEDFQGFTRVWERIRKDSQGFVRFWERICKDLLWERIRETLGEDSARIQTLGEDSQGFARLWERICKDS